MKPFLGAGAALLSGCLPFIVPPARVSAEAGPVTGGVARPAGELEPHAVTTLRAGFHPLQLVEGAPRRSFDAGVGYQGDLLRGDAPAPRDRSTTAHGPYLEVGLFPYRRRVTPASMFRWGGRATFDVLLLEPHDALGYGGSLATAIELSGETKGSFSNADEDGFAAGLGYGQWAIGAFLGGSARRFPDAHYLGLTAGISARIPLVFGLACCLGLGDDDDDDDDDAVVTVTRTKSRPRPAEPPRRRYVPAKPTPVSSLAPNRIHVPAKPKPVDGS